MATCESETTVEELELNIGKRFDLYAADIVALIEGDKGYPATHEEPGEPAGANVYDIEVTKCYVIDRTKNQEYTSVNKVHLARVKAELERLDWRDGQDEWALEQLSEAEEARYEDAQEHKAEMRREREW